MWNKCLSIFAQLPGWHSKCFSVAFENKLHLSLIRLVINIDDIARHKLLLLPINLENVELIFSKFLLHCLKPFKKFVCWIWNLSLWLGGNNLTFFVNWIKRGEQTSLDDSSEFCYNRVRASFPPSFSLSGVFKLDLSSASAEVTSDTASDQNVIRDSVNSSSFLKSKKYKIDFSCRKRCSHALYTISHTYKLFIIVSMRSSTILCFVYKWWLRIFNNSF